MNFFSHLLEPPRYLTLPTFGLDISDTSFKYVKLKRTGQGLVVSEFGAHAIPAGTIATGIIQNAEALVEALRAVFSTKKQFKYVTVSLPEEKGYVRLIRLPLLSERELAETIPLQLEEHIPLPPEEVAFTYQVVPAPKNHSTHVVLTAFPKTIVDSYLVALSRAGLRPAWLEAESQAVVRSVVPRAEHKKTVLIADIGRTRTSFVIARDGVAQYTSTIQFGSREIAKAIADALHVDENKAETLKTAYDRSQPIGESEQAITNALLPHLEMLKKEIERRISFWQQEAVQKIYLCGGEANLKILPPYLSTHLGIPAAPANVWANIITDPSYVPEIEFRESLAHATSLGLALYTI